jgi:hypothetical protein
VLPKEFDVVEKWEKTAVYEVKLGLVTATFYIHPFPVR